MDFAKHYIRSARIRWEDVEDIDIYPYNLPFIKQLEEISFHPKVTFLVGENGSGKSTLLEALAIGYGLNPEWGSKNFHFSTHDSHTDLSKHLTITKGIYKPKDSYFLRSESYYNLATNIEELDAGGGWVPITNYYGGISLHEQSHGESFFSLFMERFFGEWLYILDEPEAALSPQRQIEFLARMHQLIENKSQCIIATHAPIIMAYPDAMILQISDDFTLQEIPYTSSNNYQITKDFLENTDSILQKSGCLYRSNT